MNLKTPVTALDQAGRNSTVSFQHKTQKISLNNNKEKPIQRHAFKRVTFNSSLETLEVAENERQTGKASVNDDTDSSNRSPY